MVLFIMLYKVVLTLRSVIETLGYGHSNESYWAVLSCGTVYYVFIICGWNPIMWPFSWKLLNGTWCFLFVHFYALSLFDSCRTVCCTLVSCFGFRCSSYRLLLFWWTFCTKCKSGISLSAVVQATYEKRESNRLITLRFILSFSDSEERFTKRWRRKFRKWKLRM